MIPTYVLYELYNKSMQLQQIEEDRHNMLAKADELRQSSDDLTKFARLYVVTSDISYKDAYYEVLNIRNAKSKRPYKYNNIYWDLQEPLRSERHPRKEKVSLLNQIQKLPFTKEQLKLLKMAKDNSDDLVNLELYAFKLMDQKKQLEAINMLHFEGYMIAKEKIMFPIDKFLLSLENTTSNDIKISNDEIYTLFSRVFLTATIWLLIFIVAILMLRKKLLIPIESLTQAISSFKVGDKHEKPTIFYNDEVGLMTQKFHSMKTNLDEKFEALKQLALTDPLTQIKNRRAFFDISKEYLKLSTRNTFHLSLLILDIDFFKKVNDIYGHVIGDEVLKYLVNTVKISLREADIFARYGGEEFVILLPETKLDGAVIVAESIRLLIESTPFQDKDLYINITVSIGVKEFTNEENMSALIDNADRLLYLAKENGRNRIEH